jgi:hypothetical protein
MCSVTTYPSQTRLAECAVTPILVVSLLCGIELFFLPSQVLFLKTG